MEEDKDSSRKFRIKYLVGGAIVGGLIGALLGNPFLGSSVGMALAVIWATRIIDNSSV